MKIYKKKDNIIIEIPFHSKRFNPYVPDEDVGEFKTLVGLIYKDQWGNDKMGFAQNIDMSYKDKPDQETDIKYNWWGEKKEFIKKCEELEIEIIETPTCAYCEQSIFGSFTIGEKGNMCFDCKPKYK